jgi:hypothetical protein
MGRTPGYLPNVLRVTWHGWETELPAALGLVEESSLNGGMVGIVAADSISAEALADAVHACGYQTIRLHAPDELRTADVDQLLLDLDGSRDEAPRLQECLAAADGKPVIVAANFGLMNAHHDWKKRGISAVLFKPFVLSRLKATLNQSAAPCS